MTTATRSLKTLKPFSGFGGNQQPTPGCLMAVQGEEIIAWAKKGKSQAALRAQSLVHQSAWANGAEVVVAAE